MKVKFTKHAIQRARERNLLSYLDKKKFYYDAQHFDNNRAVLDKCVYAYDKKGGWTLIKTLYENSISR